MVNDTKIRDFQRNGIIELTKIDREKHTFSIGIIDKEENVVTIGRSNNITIQRDHAPANFAVISC